WVGIVPTKRHPVWSHRHPATLIHGDFASAEPRGSGTSLSSCMSELHAGNCALFTDKMGDWLPRFDMGIEIDAGVPGRDAPDGLHGGRFRHYQRCATHGAAAQMHQVPAA